MVGPPAIHHCFNLQINEWLIDSCVELMETKDGVDIFFAIRGKNYAMDGTESFASSHEFHHVVFVFVKGADSWNRLSIF